MGWAPTAVATGKSFVIDIISATRLSEADFWERSALGLSLRRLAHDERWAPCLTFSNARGLPGIYNERILAQNSAERLVFVHDDVWIDDYFLIDRVIEGLSRYDVIGVAGNRRRVPDQAAWPFIAPNTWDDKANLSGAIAHGQQPFGEISSYGPAPAECELLDGVFLAANTAALRDQQVLFDPRFDFHFYDMDFCRSARQRGLRLATWPICMTHQSGGAFGSPQWMQKYQAYIGKWGG